MPAIPAAKLLVRRWRRADVDTPVIILTARDTWREKVTGLRAGGDIVETFMQAGPQLVLAGVAVTTFPVLIGYAFGRKVLGLNPVLLLGGERDTLVPAVALQNSAQSLNDARVELIAGATFESNFCTS